jgi:hypothetical protein
MEQQLVELAQVAGTTAAALMATDLWQGTREGFASLWRRVRPGQEHMVVQALEQSRVRVLEAQESGDPGQSGAVAANWSERLRGLLAEDPEAAAELAAWVELIRPQLPTSAELPQPIHLEAKASGRGRVYQAGRDQHITER